MIEREYYENQIVENYGNEYLVYLRNKHQGGKNNEKGNTYENYFVSYYIARLYQFSEKHQNHIDIISQAPCFIDDLVVYHKYADLIEYFQIKNVLDLNWGEGIKSLADDYAKEHYLGICFSLKPNLNLIVSSMELKEKMERSIPAEISGFTNIHHFYYGESLVKCLFLNEDFLNSIRYLCAFEDQTDKLETVAAVLLGAWCAIGESKITLREIIEKAKGFQPSYIRVLSDNYQIKDEFVKILDNIEDFNYDIEKGFLRWIYKNGLDEGALAYDCASENFKKFQEHVIAKQPTKFEHIEQLLLFQP